MKLWPTPTSPIIGNAHNIAKIYDFQNIVEVNKAIHKNRITNAVFFEGS